MIGDPRYGLTDAAPALRPYLRALWAQDFPLLACDQPATVQRPFLSALGIHLPAHYASHTGDSARALYRAAAAHAAAHRAYSDTRFERRQLRPVQIAIISLLEDARIEALAIAAMPGLRSLWLPFFDDRSRHSESVEALLLRLAHCLLDPTRIDDHPWVKKACTLYHASQRDGSNAIALREAGALLGNDLGQMRAQFNARHYLIEPVYRDDNLFLWDSDKPPEALTAPESGMLSTTDAARSSVRADDGATTDARFRPRAVASASPDDTGRMNTDRPVYPEWDARIGHWRERWCTIRESVPEVGDGRVLSDRLRRHDALVSRLSAALQARQRGLRHRLRRQTDGDEFDLNALISAGIALRSRHTPAMRIYQRTHLQKPDLSVLLLLDLSASVNATQEGVSLWSRMSEASLLLGKAIDLSGDRLAIHGFRSDGRHDIQYLRFKEFHAPLDEQVIGRLAGIQGALSTRLGAAIRHASHTMRDCRTTQRIIMVITDGVPHDIDVFDPDILTQDAARAVAQATAEGTAVFGISVNRQSNTRLRRLFGAHRHLSIDGMDQLPQRLSSLYLRLNL